MKILYFVLPVCDEWSLNLDADIQVVHISKQG
jgi:hypothetical protein